MTSPNQKIGGCVPGTPGGVDASATCPSSPVRPTRTPSKTAEEINSNSLSRGTCTYRRRYRCQRSLSQFCSVRLFLGLPLDSRAARTYTAEFATTFCLSVLVFDTEAAERLPLIGLSFSDSLYSITEFGYVQEQSYFPIELLPDLCNFADLSVFATARRLDCCKCCQLILNSDRPPDKTRQCCLSCQAV